jgi:hypothetical protein
MRTWSCIPSGAWPPDPEVGSSLSSFSNCLYAAERPFIAVLYSAMKYVSAKEEQATVRRALARDPRLQGEVSEWPAVKKIKTLLENDRYSQPIH